MAKVAVDDRAGDAGHNTIEIEEKQDGGLRNHNNFEDAYMCHFTLVLRTILLEREDYACLFSLQEKQIAARFLQELTPLQQIVYARLFQRRGSWLKTTSLFTYFTKRRRPEQCELNESSRNASGEQDEDATEDVETTNLDEKELASPRTVSAKLPDTETVQSTLQALVNTGFLTTLPVGSDLKSAFWTEKEQVTVLNRALDAIQQCATAVELAALHKKLNGSSSSTNKKKKMAAAASTSSPSCGAVGSPTSGTYSNKADIFNSIKRLVTTQRRIDGSRIPIATLMQPIWLENYPLNRKKKSDIMVVQFSAPARELFLRMHRLFYLQSSPPFTPMSSSAAITKKNLTETVALVASKLLHPDSIQWPGLLVLFKKIQYPDYTINRHHDRAFISPEAYVCFEVATRLHRMMIMIEDLCQVEVPEGPEPDLDLKWLLSDTSPMFTAFQRLLRQASGIPDDESNDDSVVCIDPSPVDDENDWQLASWELFAYQIKQFQSFDDFVIESRRCFQAYLTWMKSDTAMTARSSTPIYFAKCNAGYHLARVLHRAVGIYEKHRQYQVAVILLNDLLAAPFLERKRGHWWERLALNLEHLKCSDQARATCINALDDVHVIGEDRITIERRLNRLQKRLSQITNGAVLCAADTSENQTIVLSNGDEDIFESESSGVGMKPDTIEDKQDEIFGELYEYPKNYITGRPLNRQMGEKSRFIGYDDEPCNVEQLVLQYYRSQHKEHGGWYGVHCEGQVFGNIFGVLLWEVLYASVPNVFQTPFQAAPLDFGYANEFYNSRKELIERKLVQIGQEWTLEQLLTAFKTTWNREHGKISRFVHWPRNDGGCTSMQYHILTVMAIGQERLAKLFRYMLTSQEYHNAQNGLPDLLLLKITPPTTDTMAAESLSTMPMDGDRVDVYDFCGMTYQLNLNDRTNNVFETDGYEEDAAKDLFGARLHRLIEEKWDVQIKLVEVKGPRDRLSDKQLLWLQVLNEAIGVETGVMYVVEEQKQLKKRLSKKNQQSENCRKKTNGDNKRRKPNK